MLIRDRVHRNASCRSRQYQPSGVHPRGGRPHLHIEGRIGNQGLNCPRHARLHGALWHGLPTVAWASDVCLPPSICTNIRFKSPPGVIGIAVNGGQRLSKRKKSDSNRGQRLPPSGNNTIRSRCPKIRINMRDSNSGQRWPTTAAVASPSRLAGTVAVVDLRAMDQDAQMACPLSIKVWRRNAWSHNHFWPCNYQGAQMALCATRLSVAFFGTSWRHRQRKNHALSLAP